MGSMQPHLLQPQQNTDCISISSEVAGEVSSSDDFEATTYDPSKYMIAKLNEAVFAGDEEKIKVFENFEQVKRSTVAAHIAAWSGNLSILSLLLQRCPSLFCLQNDRGDTPLHVAARAGQLDIVKFLLDHNSGDMERGDGGAQDSHYLRMQNKKGNTALHEALENNHEEVARLLVTAHPELSYLVNKEGKSPAYLAAEAGFLRFLKYMLKLLADGQNTSDWGREKTPLHAAIFTRHRESLNMILKHKPQLIREVDRKGRNPLHYAALIGYYDGLSKLLTKDTQAAYEPDDDGLFPIHMAASTGHINVIQLLLESCPGCWALPSRDGQNVLHVAAQSGKEHVVRYILKTWVFERLINEVDGEGNTPLHLATKARHFKVVGVLSGDSRVNMSISNNDNRTALDIAEENIATVASFRRLLTLTTLRIANAPRARNLDIFDGKHRVDNHVQRPTTEFYKDRVNTLLLVSMLVATVTFAAGFTIPGGLHNGRPDEGMATMLTRSMFKAFVICDAIALFCSILAVVSLIWAQVGDVPLMRSITGFTLALLGISLSAMAAAFTAGVYIVISHLHWLAAGVLTMSIIFLICTIALLLPLRMPIWSQYSFFQRISYYLFYLLLSAAGPGGASNGYKGAQKNLSSTPNDIFTAKMVTYSGGN